MTKIIVKTQAELDATLARDDIDSDTHKIIIDSPAGVWITSRSHRPTRLDPTHRRHEVQSAYGARAAGSRPQHAASQGGR